MKRPGLEKVFQVSIGIFFVCMCRYECAHTCVGMYVHGYVEGRDVIPQEQQTLFSETGFLTNLEFMALIG